MREKKEMNPLVSIITPCLNPGLYIEDTIRSIAAQDYSPIEHIVVDGGSIDGTLERVQRHPNIILVEGPDRGQVDAINKGFAMAKGDYINWLNADDILLPASIRALVECFREHPEADFVYGDFQLLDPKGRVLVSRHCIDFDRDVLVYGRSITCQSTCFIRRSTFLRLGPLNEKYDFCMDIEYWIRAVVGGARFVHVPRFIAAARLHMATKTSTQRDKLPQQHRMILNEYGLLPFRNNLILNWKVYWLMLVAMKAKGALKRAIQRKDLRIMAAGRAARKYSIRGNNY